MTVSSNRTKTSLFRQAGGQAESSPLLALAAICVLCIAAPALLVAYTPNPFSNAWLGALAIMLLAGLRFTWVLAGNSRRLFEMVVWLFVYVFLGTAPLVQLRVDEDPDTTPGIVHGGDWTSITIVLVGCVAIMTGSFIAGRTTTSGPRSLAKQRVSPSRTVVLAVAALAMATWYISKIGLGAVFASRDDRSYIASVIWPNSTTSAIVTAAVSMSLLVSAVAQLASRRDQQLLGRKKGTPLLAVTICVLIACVNPVSSPRYLFGTVALGLLASLGVYSTIGRYRFVVAGAMIALVFIFPFIDAFRHSLNAAINLESPTSSLLSGDYDAFAQINNTVYYVIRHGTTHGVQLLGVALFWVPRAIWVGKPTDTGILLANDRGYGFTNLSAPLWSEMYINGGWILLVFGMLAFGFAIRKWDSASEHRLAHSGIPTLLGCTIPFYLLIVLRGSLLQSMAYLSVILVCSLFVTGRGSRSLTS